MLVSVTISNSNTITTTKNCTTVKQIVPNQQKTMRLLIEEFNAFLRKDGANFAISIWSCSQEALYSLIRFSHPNSPEKPCYDWLSD